MRRRSAVSVRPFPRDRPVLFSTASQQALINFLNASPLAQLRTRRRDPQCRVDHNGADLSRHRSAAAEQIPESFHSGTPITLRHYVWTTRLTPESMFGRITFTDIDTRADRSAASRDRRVERATRLAGLRWRFRRHAVSQSEIGQRIQVPICESLLRRLVTGSLWTEININGIASLGRDFSAHPKMLPVGGACIGFAASTNSNSAATSITSRCIGSRRRSLSWRPLYFWRRPVRCGPRRVSAPGEVVPLALVIDNAAGAVHPRRLRPRWSLSGVRIWLANFSDRLHRGADLQPGFAAVYQQGFGDPRAELMNKVLSGYVQDNFKVSSGLTLNLGLRYDMEFQPTPIHRDTNNCGLSYSCMSFVAASVCTILPCSKRSLSSVGSWMERRFRR